jgi:hypothetical protein
MEIVWLLDKGRPGSLLTCRCSYRLKDEGEELAQNTYQGIIKGGLKYTWHSGMPLCIVTYPGIL